MYKLIAIDLDGTLLNSKGEVSIRNRKAIENAKKKNVEVVLTSGRPIMSVKNLANEIGANNYMICGNGAITYDIQNEKIIYERFIEKEKVLKIIEICEENNIFYTLYTKDLILTQKLYYDILFYNQENANKPENKKTNIKIVKNMKQYVKKEKNEKYLKINICDNNKTIFEKILRELKKIKDIDVLEPEHMSRKTIKIGAEEFNIEYYYTEITNINVDKWGALEDLINKLGIKQTEVIAIGDNVNDIKMIQNAGLGVVMGNAAPYIKENANFVARDNDSDGVAQIIEEKIYLRE